MSLKSKLLSVGIVSDMVRTTQLLGDMSSEFFTLRKYNGYIATQKDKGKLESFISICAHSIEKGMSMSLPRKPFGQSNVTQLLDLIALYQSRYGDKEFLYEKLAILNEYLRFHNECEQEIPELLTRIRVLLKGCDFDFAEPVAAGVVAIALKDVQAGVDFDYERFVSTRHSYRMFDSERHLSRADIEAVLSLAKYAPTSCNRQTQRVYVFHGSMKDEICWRQTGAKGFYNEFDFAILITADERAYFQDPHQVYVDGGLYAMNLLYAMHSKAMATIPLSTGAKAGRSRKKFYQSFEIPLYEAPIMLIGCGAMRENSLVNCSQRHEYTAYTKFIS